MRWNNRVKGRDYKEQMKRIFSVGGDGDGVLLMLKRVGFGTFPTASFQLVKFLHKVKTNKEPYMSVIA